MIFVTIFVTFLSVLNCTPDLSDSHLQVVVDVVEQIEADAADGLLPHDSLVQNPRQYVRYDRAGVFHSLTHRHLGVNTNYNTSLA